jgi:hypothetical protein
MLDRKNRDFNIRYLIESCLVHTRVVRGIKNRPQYIAFLAIEK